jgi:hypothetical protein
MTWNWLTFKDAPNGHRCSAHAVPAELRVPLVHDLETRGFALRRAAPLGDRLHFELGGGSIITTWPKTTIEDLGFRLVLWQHEVASLRLRTEGYVRRRFKGGVAFYKIHGYERCLVLTPEQHDVFLAALRREEARISS